VTIIQRTLFENQDFVSKDKPEISVSKGEALTFVAGEWLVLMPEKALYWPRLHTLFVADVHVGKGTAFRAQGVALPDGSTADSLARLSRCIEVKQAKRLVLLGDFLHNKDAKALSVQAKLLAWRARHSALSILLVRGNHDLKAGDPHAVLAIDCVAEGEVSAPFVLNHHPTPSSAGYALAGHVHPAVRLTGRGGESARLPCFWFGAEVGLLPSFGAFTGSHVIKPKRGDQVFAIADTEVVALHGKA
jgi:uncharacterized protein